MRKKQLNQTLTYKEISEPWRNKIITGDTLAVLKTMPDSFVQMCVTSPSYFGLRDYQTGHWEGGKKNCDHLAPPRGGRNPETAMKQLTNEGTLNYQYTDVCGKCGAIRVDQQIGIEKSPSEYITRLVEVFREVRRVLRPDGILLLNLGDSFSGSMKGYKGKGEWADRTGTKQGTNAGSLGIPPARPSDIGLAPKNLMMIPSRVAIALQEDGWYLRSMMPWIKYNSMPEPTKDRPSKAVEYIFMLTVSNKCYFDMQSVRKNDGNGRYYRDIDLFVESCKLIGDGIPCGMIGDDELQALIVNTKGYKKAHFATFSPKLIEPLIKFSTSEQGCCGVCGSSVVRKTKLKERHIGGGTPRASEDDIKLFLKTHGTTHHSRKGMTQSTYITTEWKFSCQCDTNETLPCIVLDPFAGSGTTLAVAKSLGRDYIGIDLNPDYCKMAQERVDNTEVIKK